LEFAAEGSVGNHLGGVETNAPFFQKFWQGRSTAKIHPHRVGIAIVGNALGVEESDQLAPTQDKLVDGVLSLLRNIFGVNDHQHLDLIRDGVGLHRDALNREIPFEFAEGDPRLLLLGLTPHLHHHGVHCRPAQHGKRAHDTQHRFVGGDDLRDHPSDVVFEQLLTLRGQEWNGLGLRSEADSHAEVNRIAAHLPQRHGFDAVELGSVFSIRVGLGVEPLDGDFAAGSSPELLKKVLNGLGVVLDGTGHPVLASRNVESNLYVGVDLGEDLAGTLGQGVQAVSRQVETGPHRAEQQVQAGDRDEGQADAGGREQQCLNLGLFHYSGKVRRFRRRGGHGGSHWCQRD